MTASTERRSHFPSWLARTSSLAPAATIADHDPLASVKRLVDAWTSTVTRVPGGSFEDV